MRPTRLSSNSKRKRGKILSTRAQAIRGLQKTTATQSRTISDQQGTIEELKQKLMKNGMGATLGDRGVPSSADRTTNGLNSPNGPVQSHLTSLPKVRGHNLSLYMGGLSQRPRTTVNQHEGFKSHDPDRRYNYNVEHHHRHEDQESRYSKPKPPSSPNSYSSFFRMGMILSFNIIGASLKIARSECLETSPRASSSTSTMNYFTFAKLSSIKSTPSSTI
jgi:hypothetical protein